MRRGAIVALALAVSAGCSSYKSDAYGDSGWYGSADAAGTTSWAGGGSSTNAPEAPEDEAFFALPPAQTDVFVFVTNPDRDTLTRVNVHSLEVRTIEVGNDPQIVLTTADYSTAVAFNRGDDSISVVDAATLEIQTVGVRDNFNQMRLSPDGRFAVIWHDVAAEKPDDPEPDGLQSFNEASFVDLQTLAHWPMAVGFNPRDVVFTPDGHTAAVVSDEYLATVDLTADTPEPELIQLSTEVDPPEAEEVVLAPDASFAFVRQFGATEVLVVDLNTRDVSPITVGINPTDLDLTPDGTEAVVVARGSEELYLLNVADPFAAPTVVPLPAGYAFGSIALASTGQTGVLYTTAALTDRYATWDKATGEVTVHALVKPVDKLAITPTGDSLMVVHTQDDAPDADPGSPFYGQWAMTALSLVDFRVNPLLLPAEPTAFANSTDGTSGFFVMDGQPYLERLDYVSLLHDEIALKSTPVHVGVLPDLDPTDGDTPQAWVSQDHDLGRISFYDTDDNSLETITGFELNSAIED